MEQTTWAKIDSWHIIKYEDTQTVTLCGRVVEEWPDIRKEMPLREASCETCLRIHEHAEEVVEG